MRPGLHLITLGVSDVARARGFYEALGYRPAKGTRENVVFMMAGGVILALFGREALAQDACLPAAGSGFSGVALARNVVALEEVATVLEQARAAGGVIVKVAQATAWGGHAGYFADPDGHLWEVAYNASWAIGADGTIRLPDLERQDAR
jgi:uncharacterized protein